MHFSVVIARHRLWLWPFVALVFSADPALAGPSFDCRTASRSDEQAICGSAELSALEQDQTEKFISARATGDVNRLRKTS